jgi:hypothetical protein
MARNVLASGQGVRSQYSLKSKMLQEEIQHSRVGWEVSKHPAYCILGSNTWYAFVILGHSRHTEKPLYAYRQGQHEWGRT